MLIRWRRISVAAFLLLVNSASVPASNVTVLESERKNFRRGSVEETGAGKAAESVFPEERAGESESVARNSGSGQAQSGKENLEELKKDHSLLLPGLVPLTEEVSLSGVLDLSQEQLRNLEKHCVLLKRDCHHNSLGIFRGRVLFDCKNDVHLVTPDATVEIKKGSIVYVYSTGESLVILNLHDTARKAVLVSVAGNKIELPPGRELLITHYGRLKFDEARLCPGIWYRSVYELVNKPGLKVYQTQFSTISAAAVFPSVRRMVGRGNKSGEKLAKTFAAVITVSRDRQSFRPGMKGETTKLTVVSSKP